MIFSLTVYIMMLRPAVTDEGGSPNGCAEPSERVVSLPTPARLLKCVLQNVNHHSGCSSSVASSCTPSCCPYLNQDIAKQVRGYKNRHIRIDKPPTCILDEGMYRLMSEPEGEIKPQVRLFARACVKSFVLQKSTLHYASELLLPSSYLHLLCVDLFWTVCLCRIWNSPMRWLRWKATSKLSSSSLLPLNCLL